MALESPSRHNLFNDIGPLSRQAARDLVDISNSQINSFLLGLADRLLNNISLILSANQLDCDAATAKGLSKAQIDRLILTKERIASIADSVRNIAALPDQINQVLERVNRPNGLVIDKISVPIGVLGMIYESRPNVTIDAACLAIKSRNAIILRSGSEALNSAGALYQLMREELAAQDLPVDCVYLIQDPSRHLVDEMLQADEYIDVMIPRGGQGLIRRVYEKAKMPVFAHLSGLCHVFMDAPCEMDMAKEVILNAKMRRTGICGAMETLLIHKDTRDEDVADIIAMLQSKSCQIIGDDHIQAIGKQHNLDQIIPASEQDWHTEYLEAKLSIKMVDNVRAAIDHINHYGSHHTDSILSSAQENIDDFLKHVDSGIVMENASTQFADGGEFGMGAEIGIATGKLHARGPVGIAQLLTYKYVVHGQGQTRPL